jgi:hypothetical protein
MGTKAKTQGSSDRYDGRRALAMQIARLFGAKSRHVANLQDDGRWREILRAVLVELDLYIAANVDTDEFHREILLSGLAGANEALKQEEFWPGYVEGITRLALILLGDYPDHRKRKPGRKDKNHYNLNSCRRVLWDQTPDQRLRTLVQVGNAGFPRLSTHPLDVLREFRSLYGFRPTQADFLEWYRKNYSQDYATVFR